MDCHVHVAALNQRSLELMSLANIRAVVSQLSLPDVHVNLASQSIFDFADRSLAYHAWRTQKYFIQTHVCVGVSPVGVPEDWEEALRRLPDYILSHPVVALGEVGFEPNSWTCPDLQIQEKILRAQLDIARDLGKTVAIHTPGADKQKWVSMYLGMIREHVLEPCRVVLDHADPTVVGMILDAGCYVGITVQPHRRLRPVDAAAVIMASDHERLLVNSDASLQQESDCLAVPRVALELRRMGMTEAEVERVLWENPQRAYGIC